MVRLSTDSSGQYHSGCNGTACSNASSYQKLCRLETGRQQIKSRLLFAQNATFPHYRSQMGYVLCTDSEQWSITQYYLVQQCYAFQSLGNKSFPNLLLAILLTKGGDSPRTLDIKSTFSSTEEKGTSSNIIIPAFIHTYPLKPLFQVQEKLCCLVLFNDFFFIDSENQLWFH